MKQTDVSTGRCIRYSEIIPYANRLSGYLQSCGFGPGKTALLVAANLVEVPLFTLAVWQCGASVAVLTLNLPYRMQINSALEYVHFQDNARIFHRFKQKFFISGR